MLHLSKTFFFSLVILCWSTNLYSLDVNPIFSDNMVLQQNTVIPIWGTGVPGDSITVIFKNQELKTVCNKQGNWEISISPLQTNSNPSHMLIKSAIEKVTIELKNIVVGDVWLCAGQSNMAFELYRSRNANKAINHRNEYDIRQIRIEPSYHTSSIQEASTAGWISNKTDNLKDFSAIGYYFSEEIFSKEKIPIGLINTAIGGSKIETWLSEDIYGEAFLVKYRDSIMKLEEQYLMESKNKIGYQPRSISTDSIQSLKLSSGEWQDIEVPGIWENQGFKFLDGKAYYVKDFQLSKSRIYNDEVLLRLGTIDDIDSVWVNGHFIGSTKKWDIPRKYILKNSILKKDNNRIIVKVIDNKGSGGFRGNADEFFLDTGNQIIDLSGKWKFHVAELKLASPWVPRYQPSLAYNAMISPLHRFPIKGILWYQGEQNAYIKKEAKNYEIQFQKLINDWRKKWRSKKLPFLFVQLPSYNDPRAEDNTTWAILRDSQWRATELSNTYGIVSIDYGDERDIHPIQKKELGIRLARVALEKVYQNGTKSLSPELVSFDINENEVLLYFKNIGTGLKIKKGGKIFEGIDLVNNNGEISSTYGEIISKDVVKINIDSNEFDTLQYAWRNWVSNAELVNSCNLPAVPFKISLK